MMERVQLAKSLRSLTPDTGPEQQRSAVKRSTNSPFPVAEDTMAYLVPGIKSRHNILCFGIAIYHILWYNISTGSNDSKEPKV